MQPGHRACERLRSLVRDCIAKHMLSGAIFFGSKLCSLSDYASSDVYMLAQAYYVNGEYHRALSLLNGKDYMESNIRFRYLAAKCLAACQEWDECLVVIGADDIPEILKAKEESVERSGCVVSMYAAVCALRGQAYEALGNRGRAIKWYTVALQSDPFCYEAHDALVGHQMLTDEEEKALVEGLDLRQEDTWLSLLYSTMGKKYRDQEQIDANLRVLEGSAKPSRPVPLQPSSKHNDAGDAPWLGETMTRSRAARAAMQQSSAPAAKLNEDEEMEKVVTPREAPGGCLSFASDITVVAARADLMFCQGDVLAAYGLCRKTLSRDPRAIELMGVYLASMVNLGKKNELFRVAHRLVHDYSDRGLAWYAVGCYYVSAGQYDAARRFFGKATQLDPRLSAAWMAYGHAFSLQDESDQALAAYRTAARLFPGAHQALLSMGREYLHMNNHMLAEQMYLQAYAVCKVDALTCNELGVLYYLKKDYDTAAAWLRKGVELVDSRNRISEQWQPLLLNLGHTLRKQGEYDAAVDMYQRTLGLAPHDFATFSALGFTYHLMGRLGLAIETYHKALGFHADDSLTQELLNDALHQHCNHCHQYDDPGLM